MSSFPAGECSDGYTEKKKYELSGKGLETREELINRLLSQAKKNAERIFDLKVQINQKDSVIQILEHLLNTEEN